MSESILDSFPDDAPLSYPGARPVWDSSTGVQAYLPLAKLTTFCYGCFVALSQPAGLNERVFCPMCDILQHFLLQCSHPACADVFYHTSFLGQKPEKINSLTWVCSKAHARDSWRGRLAFYTEVGSYEPKWVNEDFVFILFFASGKQMLEAMREQEQHTFLGDHEYVICLDEKRDPNRQFWVEQNLENNFVRGFGRFPKNVMFIRKDEIQETPRAWVQPSSSVDATRCCAKPLPCSDFFKVHCGKKNVPALGYVDPVARQDSNGNWFIITCFPEGANTCGLEHVSALRKGKNGKPGRYYVATPCTDKAEAEVLVDHIMDCQMCDNPDALKQFLIDAQLAAADTAAGAETESSPKKHKC